MKKSLSVANQTAFAEYDVSLSLMLHMILLFEKCFQLLFVVIIGLFRVDVSKV